VNPSEDVHRVLPVLVSSVLMSTIDYLPDEVIVRILEKGCEELQVTWDDVIPTKCNSYEPTYKPLVRVGRSVCKRWRDAIYNSPEPSRFHMYFFNLATNHGSGISIKELYRFRNGLARVKKGCEILISLRSTGQTPSEHYRLFLHGMSFIKPVQSQIYGLYVDLHDAQTLSHFLRLFVSLDLPALTVLDIQGDTRNTLHEIWSISPVQGFKPLFPQQQISITRSDYHRLRRLRVPNATWFDIANFEAVISVLITSVFIERNIYPGKWFLKFFGSQDTLCRNLTHLRITINAKTFTDHGHLFYRRASLKGPPDQVSFQALKSLEVVADPYPLPLLWLKDFIRHSIYPDVEQLKIKYLSYRNFSEAEMGQVRAVMKKSFPNLHILVVRGLIEHMFPLALPSIPPLKLKNMTVGKEGHNSMDWRICITRTHELLLIKAIRCDYKVFLDLMKVHCQHLPPRLEITTDSSFSFSGYPSRKSKDRFSAPMLEDFRVSGFHTVILEDFFFRLDAPNLSQVSISYGPYTDLNHPNFYGDDDVSWKRTEKIEATRFSMVRSVNLEFEENLGHQQVIDILDIFPNVETLQIDFSKENRWGLKLLTMNRLISLLRPHEECPPFPLLRVLDIRISWILPPRVGEVDDMRDDFSHVLEERANGDCILLGVSVFEWSAGSKACIIRAANGYDKAGREEIQNR